MTQNDQKAYNFYTYIQWDMNENYANCPKSRSNWKTLVGKLLMRGWKMPKFLHFQSTCKNGSLSFTMLKSPELFVVQWPGMLKVSYYGKILDLTPLWYYTSWDSQVTWWFQFLILREKRPKKSPMSSHKGWNYFLSLVKCFNL